MIFSNKQLCKYYIKKKLNINSVKISEKMKYLRFKVFNLTSFLNKIDLF